MARQQTQTPDQGSTAQARFPRSQTDFRSTGMIHTSGGGTKHKHRFPRAELGVSATSSDPKKPENVDTS
jgi:hypothetical protein